MNYTGKLYGKLGSIRFDTGKTADDWDSMEKEVSELREQVRKLREGLEAILKDAREDEVCIEMIKQLLTETEG